MNDLHVGQEGSFSSFVEVGKAVGRGGVGEERGDQIHRCRTAYNCLGKRGFYFTPWALARTELECSILSL